jgi:hypothetical protein
VCLLRVPVYVLSCMSVSCLYPSVYVLSCMSVSCLYPSVYVLSALAPQLPPSVPPPLPTGAGQPALHVCFRCVVTVRLGLCASVHAQCGSRAARKPRTTSHVQQGKRPHTALRRAREPARFPLPCLSPPCALRHRHLVVGLRAVRDGGSAHGLRGLRSASAHGEKALLLARAVRPSAWPCRVL